VKDFCLQGGDVNGRGGDSIYGGAFKDDKAALKLKHHFGCVSMANSGPNSNRSQFFFCLREEGSQNPCDGKYVVFGRVTNEDGIEFLRRMNRELEQNDQEEPRQAVFVIDAGLS
jgi:cyclophilin family peptidyl-prolyl cis-trans isomerase